MHNFYGFILVYKPIYFVNIHELKPFDSNKSNEKYDATIGPQQCNNALKMVCFNIWSIWKYYDNRIISKYEYIPKYIENNKILH